MNVDPLATARPDGAATAQSVGVKKSKGTPGSRASSVNVHVSQTMTRAEPRGPNSRPAVSRNIDFPASRPSSRRLVFVSWNTSIHASMKLDRKLGNTDPSAFRTGAAPIGRQGLLAPVFGGREQGPGSQAPCPGLPHDAGLGLSQVHPLAAWWHSFNENSKSAGSESGAVVFTWAKYEASNQEQQTPQLPLPSVSVK